MIVKKIKEFLEKELSVEDAASAIEFLNLNFSKNGQIAIASIFLYAKEQGVSIPAEVIPALKNEWERSWNYQHPELRADPDAPANAGIQNRAILLAIYSKTGIILPTEQKEPA